MKDWKRRLQNAVDSVNPQEWLENKGSKKEQEFLSYTKQFCSTHFYKVHKDNFIPMPYLSDFESASVALKALKQWLIDFCKPYPRSERPLYLVKIQDWDEFAESRLYYTYQNLVLTKQIMVIEFDMSTTHTDKFTR